MVLKRRDATFICNFCFTAMLKPTRFISFDIWNYWIKKSSHDLIYDSNHKNEHTTPFSVFSYVREFCENHPKTTPKYLLSDKHRYAYKNNIWVVSALTFNRSTGFKLRMAQKIVASLFVKTFDFLTIFVHVFDVKTGWQRTQKVTTHPVLNNISKRSFLGQNTTYVIFILRTFLI